MSNVVGFTLPRAKKGTGVPKKGKRGRPALPVGKKKKPVTYRLEAYIVEFLQNHPDSQASLIEKALIKTYKIKKPK